jgi:hypothetical protein
MKHSHPHFKNKKKKTQKDWSLGHMEQSWDLHLPILKPYRTTLSPLAV